jgi:hypothetical protein
MKSKQDVIALAQRTANREGKAMAVLNLNAFSPIYVVRDWNDRHIGQRELLHELILFSDPSSARSKPRSYPCLAG